MSLFKIVASGIACVALSLVNLVVVYTLLASPPMHLVYDVVPPAGPSSVYVPGSGFSGFWFHLGALQKIPDLHKFDYYCYSSGCLSVLMAAMNVSVSDASTIAYGIQNSWMEGNMTRFELVDYFLHGVLGDEDDGEDERIESFLPHLKILVTSKGSGVNIMQPTSRSELVDALKKTTWIPFVTGDGVMRPSAININSTDTCSSSSSAVSVFDSDDFYIDGGFSRMLHPICEYDLRVPNTWINMLYTLHPGMSPQQVEVLWESGRNFDHPLLLASQ